MGGVSDTQALLEEAQEAVQAGDWSAAKQGFEAALERGEAGEALFGLGIALQWLGDSEAAIRYWERAYADFRRRRDAQQALLAAFYLCLGYRMILGNEAASRGWCERAASVVQDLDAAELNGWVELARAYVANESGRPQEGELHAREALALARETGDIDLELCTRSELGAALVAIGRVEEGTALLDEAMAGALAGEGDDLDTVVMISCRTVASCDRGAMFGGRPSGCERPTSSIAGTAPRTSTQPAARTTAASCSPRAGGRRPSGSSRPRLRSAKRRSPTFTSRRSRGLRSCASPRVGPRRLRAFWTRTRTIPLRRAPSEPSTSLATRRARRRRRSNAA